MSCCFVCGCDKAKWPIFSQPTANREPFFPFLDYHKPQNDTGKVEKQARYIVCNVCYAFLIQQWNSYEENGTPLSKRLYWVKHDRNEEGSFIGDSSFDTREVEDDAQSNNNGFGLDDESNPASLQESSSNGSDDDESVVKGKETSDAAKLLPVQQRDEDVKKESAFERDKDEKIYLKDEKLCFICRHPKEMAQLRVIHTRPQIKRETQFYPTLVNMHSDHSNEIGSQGNILTCTDCHEKLVFQWQLYAQRGIPVADRKYVFDANIFVKGKPACFICGKNDQSVQNDVASSKGVNKEPYFPFLKNLKEPSGAQAINSEGMVKCCSKCTNNIYNQWFDYEEAKIPIYDQVYVVVGKTEASAIVNHAPVSDEKEIICLICQRRKVRKFMKEVYSNPYANMDLSFLESIEKIPGTYYARNSGQVLACIACYQSLVYQWQLFDENDVALDQREYKLQRYDKEDDNTACQICKTVIDASESCETFVQPIHGDDTLPFFPCLARSLESKTGNESKIKTCSFCNQNLILQWKHYERDSAVDDDRWKRNYKPHHFVCFLCSSAAHRTNIIILHRHSCHPLKNVSQHHRPLLSIDVNGFVAVCLQCKEMLDVARSDESSEICEASEDGARQIKKEIIDTNETEKNDEERFGEAALADRSSPCSANDSNEGIGMKVTATVPPLPSLLQRNQEQGSSMQNQSASARNDDEGSFAAALRKLAQQAIVPVGRRPGARERQPTPPSSYKTGATSREARQSPPRTNASGRQSHSPFYSRNSMRPSSITSSSVASILPSASAFDKDKSEGHNKASFGAPSTPDEHSSRRLSRPIIPGVFPRHETNESIYRQKRDEGSLHHGEKSSMREPSESASRSHSTSGIVNGPSNGQMNILGVKDRGSNIGLVHPQPVRKLPDDDALKSGIISSIRSHPMESPASLFRPPSPSDNLSRYQLMHGMHQHNSQGTCPVHGHEPGHHHGSPRDHAARPGRLPFDGITPRAGPLSEYRGVHSHHQRMRDEIYGINRIPVERREGLPNHMLEEDLRRRGYDWSWPMQHPVYESEQYRRHVINGYRGSEHAYKDMMHGPHYLPPHLYYPPEYPPIDPYAHPSLPHSDVYSNRYGSAQLSPRLYDYYRRERSLSDRMTDRTEPRRQDSASLKLSQGESERRTADATMNDGRGLEERHSRRSEISDYFSFSRERVAHIPGTKDDRKERSSLENIIGAIGKKANADSEEPRRKLRIMEKLDLIAKPYEERGSSIDEIVIKEEPETPIPTSYHLESPQNEIAKERTLSEGSDEISRELTLEDTEKKADFMSSIGLISHGKRRVLEEDYERKRWERKVAKMRGRPRKRRRREHTEDSDGRPCSELDFYNGPMTRHKQQLLQEQEMLLEQVQKNHLERNGSKETNSSTKAYSTSSSPSNSSVTSTTPNSINESLFQPTPLERRTETESSSSYANKSQSFKPYKERQSRKDFASGNTAFQKCGSLFSRENQELDGFVFGLPQVDVTATKCHWPGVDGISRLFADYENEREVKETKLRSVCDKLKFETEKLNHEKQHYQKEILALRDKKSRLSDNFQRHQNVAKSLFGALRKISSI